MINDIRGSWQFSVSPLRATYPSSLLHTHGLRWVRLPGPTTCAKTNSKIYSKEKLVSQQHTKTSDVLTNEQNSFQYLSHSNSIQSLTIANATRSTHTIPFGWDVFSVLSTSPREYLQISLEGLSIVLVLRFTGKYKVSVLSWSQASLSHAQD